jgi:SAM-dependent methyltransferase
VSQIPRIFQTSRRRGTLKRVRPLVAVRSAAGGARYVALRQARLLERRALDPLRVRRYLDAHPVRKLQLGAGPNPVAGWLNTDLLPDIYAEHRRVIVFLDAARPFPLGDMTFDYIFSEHQIEHISEMEARSMVRECFRVLRPGGRIRVATPDLAAIVGLYGDTLNELERHYIEFMMARFMPGIQSDNPSCHVINHVFRAHGHRFIYDERTLSETLARAGFVDVTRWELGESSDPALRGLEAHGRTVGDEDVNRLETMVLEASRPQGPTANRA